MPSRQIVSALIVFVLLFGAAPALAQQCATVELRELEQYRFNKSQDVTKKGTYRFGHMNWKTLHLAWETIKELKAQKTSVSAMQTDIKWIKEALEKLQREKGDG